MNLMRKGTRGAVYPMVALALVALVGMAALTVDVGVMIIARQQLQAAVDAAALAGVSSLQTELNPEQAAIVARETAAMNPVLGDGLTLDMNVDVTIGAYIEATGEIVPFDRSGGVISVPEGMVAVRVRGRRTTDAPDGPVPLHFARVLGREAANVTAESTAGLTISKRQRPPVEAVIVQDQSGSFEDEFPYARAADQQFVNFMAECYAPGDRTGVVGFTYHPNATVPPANSLKKRDTWLYHNYALTSNDPTDPNGKNQTYNYIGSMATVPFNAYPDGSAYTNLYTGLLMAVLQFAPPAKRETAWNNFINSLYYNGTFRNIGWWRRNNYTSLKSKMAPLFNQGFQNPDSAHVIVLVSDGMPWYHENSYPDTRSQDLCRYIADQAAARGIRIHTVTLDQSTKPPDGSAGSDSQFNASLTRNGGYAFYTYEAQKLANLLVGVGQVEVGQAHLIR